MNKYTKTYNVRLTDENGKELFKTKINTCGGKKDAERQVTNMNLPFSEYYIRTTLIK